MKFKDRIEEEMMKPLNPDDIRQIDDKANCVFSGGFGLRDEANAIAAFCFRNTTLEDLHAGDESELLQNPRNSRITDTEMKALMIEVCRNVHIMLKLREIAPDKYNAFVRVYGMDFCRKWER